MALNSVSSSNLVEAAVTSRWCTTQSKLIKFSYTWTIENFSLLCEQNGEDIQSSEFSAGDNDKFKWCLKLYPKGHDQECKEYLSIYLDLLSAPCDKSSVMCKFKFSIINAKREKINKANLNAIQFKINDDLGSPKFIRRDTLLDEANCFLPNDKLTICCEASFVADRATISGQDNSLQLNTTPECKLSEDFNNLIINENFSDVILEIGGREIRAHKQILSAQSDVFAAMFKHNSEEHKLDRVPVEDMDDEILREVLRFIYTGKVSNLEKIVKDLFAAADKYALNKLKVMCGQVLSDSLSIETAADTLILACLHSCIELKELTIYFIKSHIRDVMNTKGWQKLKTTSNYSNLLAEIIETLA